MKRKLALLLAVACGLTLPGCGGGGGEPATGGQSVDLTAHQLVQAEYPEMAPYPDESAFFNEDGEFDYPGYEKVYDAWWEDQQARRARSDDYADSLDDFLEDSIRQVLTDTSGTNRVYSPLNVYMALAMTAELTDGESRQQILDLLGASSMESLRTQASALWNAHYCDDGALTSKLASSLWLSEDVTFVQETMDRLARTYYASSFRGTMGSAELNEALQTWLNEQTGGLLEEQAGNVELSADTIMALATTIYFRARWQSEFLPENTRPGQFQLLSADGGSVTCDFMHQSGSRTYYWGDHFSAVAQPMEGAGEM